MEGASEDKGELARLVSFFQSCLTLPESNQYGDLNKAGSRTFAKKMLKQLSRDPALIMFLPMTN